MPKLRFALDENVAHSVASLLRSHGHDADSARELGRLGLSDVQVLVRAAEDGQTLVTHNGKDFRLLHEAWTVWRWRWENEAARLTGSAMRLSRHAGIVITPPLPTHDLARMLEALADSPRSMDDRLFAWSGARGWHELRVGRWRPSEP